ncbi:lysine transporter LysE [Arthrobacter sp. MYb227]|uniref:LysE family translocator n=1 Tax=Arthrobacter sp. MYb227 TaxID=1848601 RepID=UPI000CFD5B59|nr:LysE family translocator [Arthrobacter sp. MYb227]PQZ92940.1 lysine transporter LysE [Arthrobacter sp. MYb227]
MDQFIAVATAHFLALLVPGVDFFLIARTTLANGWRTASGTCLGIAAANGIFIIAAFSGISMISHPAVLQVIQGAGGLFLTYIGLVFLRATISLELTNTTHGSGTGWWKNLGLGFASGFLNPKNALFYLSLATALSGAGALPLMLYGSWMFFVVLGWDLFIAVLLGSNRSLSTLSRLLPLMTKTAGAFLILLGAGMFITLAMDLVR